MTAKDDDVASRMEAILAAKEAELEAAKAKKPTVVGKIMEQGGGAAAGAGLGWLAGGVAAVALAPLTGGLSILVAPAMAIAGGVIGHKASKDIDD